MRGTLTKIADVLHMVSIKVIVCLSFLLFSFLMVLNLVSTAYFDETYAESTKYEGDSILVFLMLAGILMVLYVLAEHLQILHRIQEKVLVGILLAYAFAFSVAWVLLAKGIPVADRGTVSNIAGQFIHGDYSAFEQGRYLYNYPHQLGVIALIEGIYRVFGVGAYQWVQILNCVAVCVSLYAVYGIAREIRNEKDGKKDVQMTLLFLFGAWCLFFFCTYVYGNIFGLAFALLGVWGELVYLRSRNVWCMIGAAAAIVIACILKNNYLIFLVGMGITLALDWIKRRQLLTLLAIVLLAAWYICVPSLLNSYYENRADVQIQAGIPKVMWVSLGLSDGWFGAGTYTDDSVKIYQETGYVREQTQAIGTAKVLEQIEFYQEHPQKALNFFAKKLKLIWTEPTYMSIWESNCVGRHSGELTALVQSIYTGEVHRVLMVLMNFFQSLVWTGAVIYMIVNRKRLTEGQLLPGMIIIGGFLFHLVWEAKSQYVIQYFIVAIPYGASGFRIAADWVKLKMKQCFKETRKRG